VAASTGWTLPEVGALTIPELEDMERYWRRYPPLHVLAAGWLGFESTADDEAWDDAVLTPADLAELKARWEKDQNGNG